MSNYPNMSYCMAQNTLLAMQQVIDAMAEGGAEFFAEMSREERRAFLSLFDACEDFVRMSEESEALAEALEQQQ
jgi:hypothetical protein